MRLRRLNLIRYGHFTGRTVDLPRQQADLHIIFGPNEAGKSTTLTAIEDLLFTVSERSPHGFLHGNQNLRIGALLEADAASLEVVRRKGRKDTLLDTEGHPLAGGEAVLRPFLAGADQSFFQRMFSLDHERLRSGGQEILEAKDDVGQMLFSAGSGVAGLRDLLNTLSEEADGLWTARRGKERRFYIVHDKLAEAQKALREQTLTTSKWQELKQARDEAEAAYETISEEIKEKTAEGNRLGRIRRVFHNLRRMQELEREFEALAEVALLPEDAGAVLQDLEREDSLAAARRTTLEEQLHQEEKNLDALTFDEALIGKAIEVRDVAEQGIKVRSGRESLPKREAELALEESKLGADSSELGWLEVDVATVYARIPPRSKVRVVRELLPRHGKLASEVESQAKRLQESRESHEVLKRQEEETEAPLDVTRLAATIRALRQQGDLSGAARAAEKAFRDAEARVQRRLRALKPAVADEAALMTMSVPTRAEVEVFRDRKQDWQRRLQAAQQQVLSFRQERDAAQAAFDQRVRDEKLITPEELDEARKHRDRLWALVKGKHVAGDAVPEDLTSDLEAALPNPASAFEPAMAAADALADRRFDQAEAAGQIAEIKRKIGELATLLEQAQENESRLARESEALTSDWVELWQNDSFEPATLETMLTWLDEREQVLEEIESRETAQTTWESLLEEERAAKDLLLTELAAVSVDIANLVNDSLPIVIERAAESQLREEAKARKRADLEDAIKKLETEISGHERHFGKANGALDAWRHDWRVALAELGLAEELTVEAIEPALDLIEDLRKTAAKISDLRHNRIDKIKQDLASFDQAVRDLVTNLADDFATLASEEAIAKLLARLNEAEKTRDQHERALKAAEELRKQIRALDAEVGERRASLSHLKEMAAVADTPALKSAITQSDRKRALQRESLEIIERLRCDGDGKSLEELVEESTGVAFDEISALTESIAAEVDSLRAQEHEAIEVRSKARDAFQAIGGDDAAARAAADREEALSEMRDVAERYVRVRTSAILLQWAIDRYRREKQAPLLTRAGALFALLTGHSFASLDVAFGEQDKAELRGLRPDGSQLAISGMSSGTADQLYLALRVAAVEDYLERAEALPFVADDLFINFDDARAAAGLRILQDLSRKTQVLFFTHHQHLVDLAQQTFVEPINLVRLTDQQAATS